jgi:hypothetical protein
MQFFHFLASNLGAVWVLSVLVIGFVCAPRTSGTKLNSDVSCNPSTLLSLFCTVLATCVYGLRRWMIGWPSDAATLCVSWAVVAL